MVIDSQRLKNVFVVAKTKRKKRKKIERKK